MNTASSYSATYSMTVVDKTTSTEQLRQRLIRDKSLHCPVYVVLTNQRERYLVREFAVFVEEDKPYIYHRTRAGTLMSSTYPVDPSSFSIESRVEL